MPLEVGPDEDRGQRLGGLPGLGADLDEDDVAAAGAHGELVDLDRGRVGLGIGLEGRDDFRRRVVLVEGHGGAEARGQGQQRHEADGRALGHHVHLFQDGVRSTFLQS